MLDILSLVGGVALVLLIIGGFFSLLISRSPAMIIQQCMDETDWSKLSTSELKKILATGVLSIPENQPATSQTTFALDDVLISPTPLLPVPITDEVRQKIRVVLMQRKKLFPNQPRLGSEAAQRIAEEVLEQSGFKNPKAARFLRTADGRERHA